MSIQCLEPDLGRTIAFPRTQLPLGLPTRLSKHARSVQDVFDLVEPMGNLGIPPSSSPFPMSMPWALGAVYGSSGSGKTSTLSLFACKHAEMFGLQSNFVANKPVIDQVHHDPAEAQQLLQEVGFKSVPAWLAQFRFLSTGQKARVELTRALRALQEGCPMVIIDEFGSTLDPMTREAMAYTFARAVYRRAYPDSHVIVAINDERILPWLQPCWVFDVDACEYRFSQRFLDAPEVRQQLAKTFRLRQKGALLHGLVFQDTIPLEITLQLADSTGRRRVWEAVKHNHYLDHKNRGSMGFFIILRSPYLVAGKTILAGICMLICNAAWSLNERTSMQRFAARFVVIPALQGLGIGPRAACMVAEVLATAGLELRFTTSHPALIRSFESQPKLWASARDPQLGSDSAGTRMQTTHMKKPNRMRHFFKYVGGPGKAPKINAEVLACAPCNKGCSDQACDADYSYSTIVQLRTPWT